ncbi:hypothetical protein HJ590_05860 [Naumannella sp. ID2617S]|uniref:Uncharacterized protein n=1 Tax=Enemella dayhoffiae TaxID=2016507 RepID=A0A255HBA7_9ACTN|nr:hypothetical protein [Enemella dayhoffiae]NNG19109.1 hypothetical protein [Naumannella sp. ID2617S]OYO24283.1 hypothetical protein CGZ93_04050 [Enemella dayhoffiae]
MHHDPSYHQPTPQLERLAIRQRIAMTINRYEVRALDPAGNEGMLLALAEQKRFKLKEQINFFADETRSQVVFSLQARQIMDIAPTLDITDGSGRPIGWIRKEFGKSFLRTTWTAADAWGNEFVGTERSQFFAILRRVVDLGFFESFYHFDFTAPDGQPVLHHSRAGTLRDCYSIDLPAFNGPHRLDWRLAAGIGVALDVMQAR